MSKRGMVTSVEVNEEDERVYVTVVVSPEKSYDKILYTQPAPGMWVVPQEKDIIEVYERADGRFAARSPEQADTFFPSGLSTGDIVVAGKNGSGLYIERNADRSYTVTLQGPETDTQMRVKDGDITIVSAGDITIDGGSVDISGDTTIEGIDFDTHTHDYSWTDSGGSGTTSGPN